MNIFADRYQFRARIIPEFLAALPIFVLLMSYGQDILFLGIASLALFFVFFQGHFSAQLGRNLQEKLRKEKKIISNSDFLIARYRENKQNKYILHLYEAADKSDNELDFNLNNEAKIAEQIDHVITWLRGHTRDKEKFPVVFDKLCDYGFQRNMLALKYWSLGILVLVELWFIIKSVFMKLPPHFAIEIVVPGVFLIVLWLFFWIKVVSLNALKKANEEYIKSLLEAALSVERKQTVTSQEFQL